MEKISEMIKRMCPEGVERVRLDSVCTFVRGMTITAKDTIKGDVPVIAGGQTPSYYHNVANRNGESIVVAGSGAYAGFVTYWNIPIYVSDAFTVEPQEVLIPKYLFFFLKQNQKKIFDTQKGAGVPHVHGKDIAGFLIPLPPLVIQQEIVRILDFFTQLQSNLEAELVVRQKQYEFYRNKLFTFDKDDESVEWKILGDVGEVRMCKRILKSQTNSEVGIPFYKIGTFGGVADAFISKELYDDYKSKYNYPKKGDILISAAGTIGRTVEFDGQPSYFQDSNIVWIENDEKYVTNKYLKFFYSIADWKIQNGGSVSRLYNDNLKSTIIPIPSLQRQQEIVSTLDTFESLITNLKKEIEARKKQYEYYREQLLTFE